MHLHSLRPTILAIIFLLPMLGTRSIAHADTPAPKVLFDSAAQDDSKWIAPNDGSDADVKYAVQDGGIQVTVAANGKSGFPGIKITPTLAWDASGHGHIECKITNDGTKPIRPSLRIDNDGPWQENRWSAGVVSIKPGQSAVVSAIFGYQYGKAAYDLKPDAVFRAIIFIGKSDVEQKFRITDIQAAGDVGEKPYIDPSTVAVKPPGGVIIGKPILLTKDGVKAFAAEAKGIKVEIAGQNLSATIKPATGMWNLNEALQIRVKLKNTGTTPATPSVQLLSKGGPGEAVSAALPITPGTEAEIVVPFTAATPWKGLDEPEMKTLEVKKEWADGQPGTGTRYKSNVTTGIVIVSDRDDLNTSVQVESIIADLPTLQPLPEWLGQKPPVDGDWTKTFEDNFDGDAIDLHKWNIYTEGEWHLGAQTHYTKDNVIVKDGTLTLRVSKTTGHHDDNPKYAANDYATGYADTYGKWVQRYGYFEARMKLPTANSMFLAFWMMPDRGLAAGSQPHRADTKNDGMEFDIMETLSIWGPYRHDFGMHWDGYQKYHKSTGDFGAYVQPDKDGFITVGMLWEPGKVKMYDNGKEAAEWATSRIGSAPEYFILDLITGGWEADPLDDKQLPADYVFDYVRAWQRKDWASAVDGPKPNDGGPLPPTK